MVGALGRPPGDSKAAPVRYSVTGADPACGAVQSAVQSAEQSAVHGLVAQHACSGQALCDGRSPCTQSCTAVLHPTRKPESRILGNTHQHDMHEHRHAYIAGRCSHNTREHCKHLEVDASLLTAYRWKGLALQFTANLQPHPQERRPEQLPPLHVHKRRLE